MYSPTSIKNRDLPIIGSPHICTEYLYRCIHICLYRDQELRNLVATKDYQKAIVIALDLGQPHRLVAIISGTLLY